MCTVLDLERRSPCGQLPYLYADATRSKPRVVRGESRASGISLAGFEYTDAASVCGVPDFKAIRHVLPLDGVRQQARVAAKVDDAETAADSGLVKRVLDLACGAVPEGDLATVSVCATGGELAAVCGDGDGGEDGGDAATDGLALAGFLADVPDL